MTQVEELVERVRSARITDNGIPRDAGLGLPVPVFGPSGGWLYFPLFRVDGCPPAAPALGAPAWLLIVSLGGGAVTSARWEGVDPALVLGVHDPQPALAWEEQQKLLRRMWSAMSELIKLGPRLPARPPGEARQAAGVLREIWQRIAHEPLRPYYRQINPSWFEFLEIP